MYNHVSEGSIMSWPPQIFWRIYQNLQLPSQLNIFLMEIHNWTLVKQAPAVKAAKSSRNQLLVRRCQDSGRATGKVVPDRSPFQGWWWAQNRRRAVYLSLWTLPCVKGLLLEQCKASLLCRLRGAKVQHSGLKGRVGATWRFAISAGAGNCIPWCGNSLMGGRSLILGVWCCYPLTDRCWRAYCGAVHFLDTPHANLIHSIQNCQMFQFISCGAMCPFAHKM